MASSSSFANSPTMVMAPQNHAVPDQYFHEGHYKPVQTITASGLPTPSESTNGMSMSSLPPTPSAGSIAGRKRSREDIFDPEDEHLDGALSAQSIINPQASQVEPVCGPGMTLIYPNDPSGYYSPDASAQPGSWPEQRAEEPVTARSIRPIIASRKSQRLDSSAFTASIAPAVPRTPGSEPLIDEASRMLGISWTRMDASENLMIAKNAYQRWIAKHYPVLSKIELWFENSAIPGYLGKATNQATGVEEYYLWSHDLHQAILVTRQPNDLIIKLSSPQMSLSQATESIRADLEPVVEATAANAAILRNDRFLIDSHVAAGGMDVD